MMITDRDRCHAGILNYVFVCVNIKVVDDSDILVGWFTNCLRLNDEQKSN